MKSNFFLQLPLLVAMCLGNGSVEADQHSTAAQPEILKLLLWEDFFSPLLIDAWTRETGVTVEIIVFDSDDERDLILTQDTVTPFDLLVIASPAGDGFGEGGYLSRLDTARLPNLRHLDPRWVKTCGAYSVPYAWGTMGIVYRQDKIAKPVSWKTLLSPDRHLSGHVSMLLDVTDTLAPALAVLGYSLNTGQQRELESAWQLLLQQSAHVLTYQYVYSSVGQKSAEKEIHAALAYSGDQHGLNEMTDSGNWEYVVPEEGTYLWVDCLAISARSEKQALALQFLDYINEPERAGKNAEALGMTTANLAALAHTSAEYRADSTLFPDAKLVNSGTTYEVLEDANLRIRDRIIHSLRKHHESQ